MNTNESKNVGGEIAHQYPPDAKRKTLMLGKTEVRRRRGRQRMKWLDGIADSMDISLSKHWEIVKDREAWHAAAHGITEWGTT